jgi:hypothetical protein
VDVGEAEGVTRDARGRGGDRDVENRSCSLIEIVPLIGRSVAKDLSMTHYSRQREGS